MTEDTSSTAQKRRGNNKTYLLMRQLHLWVGAWGAIAALLFGLTGLILNHRMGENAWPQGESKEVAVHDYAVPEQARGSAEALSLWLKAEHGLDANMIRKGRPGGGNGSAKPKEPPKWNVSGGSVRNSWSADFAPGDTSVTVKHSRNSTLSVFNRLHKGVGGTYWRVLSDSYAIAMILLGITGIWMWARGRTAKDMLLSVMTLALLALGSALLLAFS